MTLLKQKSKQGRGSIGAALPPLKPQSDKLASVLDIRIWQFVRELFPAFLLGVAFGALVLWLWSRGRIAVLRERLRHDARQLEDARLCLAENDKLRIELATLEARRTADADRLAWIHTADEQLRASFQVLAGEALRQSSQSLLERSGEQLRHLVEPVEKALDALGSQVREMEKARHGAYQGLRQEIKLLRDAHGALRSTALGLKQALKSPAVRGRWGEFQLRRVVEMAGLVEHFDFDQQPTADGLRPDLIVHLPRGGVLPIDAKAPMSAYLAAAEADDETARRTHLDAHLKALRQRTVELGRRRYWDRFDNAPDFVIMFVPSEASLGGAFERDPDFLDFALRHRVLPATPVTLLALLKSVAYGWQQHRVAENARDIASAGRQLHHRLIRFLDHLGRLGKSLGTATETYNQAVGSLERRVLPAARRLEEAGAAVAEISEPEPVDLGEQTGRRRVNNEVPPVKVPFFRPEIDEAEIAEVVDTLRSGWLTTGPRAKRFEQAFAQAVGARHAVALASCTAALHLATEALGLAPGQVVLVPAMTFAATAEVVRYAGAVPVFVDCEPGTLNLDLRDAERKLEALVNGTLSEIVGEACEPVGLIPVHVGGLMIDVAKLRIFAERHRLWVVEDAAHAFPAAWRAGKNEPWQRCGGGTSDVACFSFYANKTITTGEGGMAVTERDDLAERMRSMSLHGLSHDAWGRYTAKGAWDYRILAPGYKYNLTDVAAALGLHQLARAEKMRAEREAIAGAFLEDLAEVEEIELPRVDQDRVHSWHLFQIKLNLERLRIDRDRFLEEMRERAVGFSVHWRPLHLHPYYQKTFGWRPEHLPAATEVWRRTVSLPIFPAMTTGERDAVIAAVRDICRRFRRPAHSRT